MLSGLAGAGDGPLLASPLPPTLKPRPHSLIPPTHPPTLCCAADVFLSLDDEYQRVIADICRKMGAGMADFVEKGEEGGDSVSAAPGGTGIIRH